MVREVKSHSLSQLQYCVTAHLNTDGRETLLVESLIKTNGNYTEIIQDH